MLLHSLGQQVDGLGEHHADMHRHPLSHRQGKLEEALTYFKSALKADPANEEARYNYEMVKKKLEEQGAKVEIK